MNVKYKQEAFAFKDCTFSILCRALKSRTVMCGLKSPEKWAEMSSQIAFDLLNFMQVSHILICVLLTSSGPPLSSQCEL